MVAVAVAGRCRGRRAGGCGHGGRRLVGPARHPAGGCGSRTCCWLCRWGRCCLRRRWPVPVAVVRGSALAGWFLLGHRGELLSLATMVALYTVAVQGDRRRTVLAGLVAVPGSAALGWVTTEPASAPVAEMLWPAAALLLGEVVRGRRELAAEYAARQARAVADREREARRRVQRERLRIAREFHDVVAHTMAAVNVQMGVAVAAFDQRPDTARSALQQARSASAEALAELRAVLSLLREDRGGALGVVAPDQVEDRVGVAGHLGEVLLLVVDQLVGRPSGGRTRAWRRSQCRARVRRGPWRAGPPGARPRRPRRVRVPGGLARPGRCPRAPATR